MRGGGTCEGRGVIIGWEVAGHVKGRGDHRVPRTCSIVTTTPAHQLSHACHEFGLRREGGDDVGGLTRRMKHARDSGDWTAFSMAAS